VLLGGTTVEDLKRALDPLPIDAPSIVFGPPMSAGTVDSCIDQIIDALERTAIDLFPAWLPTVTDLVDSPAAEAAAKAAALTLAAGAEDFGPFLVELAVSSLRGRPVHELGIQPQPRAAGLARVIARSMGRTRTALVLEVPVAQIPQDEVVLTGTARWFAEYGGFAVWLVGGPLVHTDWISSRSVAVGEPESPQSVAITPAAPIQLGAQGKPKPGIESLLGAALVQAGWAGHHIWNAGLNLGPLGPMVHPDIRWPKERLIVEVDGTEHHSAGVYATDRRRDTSLLLQGYTVIRFTNQHVQSDLSDVLHTIRAVLLMRRSPSTEV
jgi:hypothetical protein